MVNHIKFGRKIKYLWLFRFYTFFSEQTLVLHCYMVPTKYLKGEHSLFFKYHAVVALQKRCRSSLLSYYSKILRLYRNWHHVFWNSKYVFHKNGHVYTDSPQKYCYYYFNILSGMSNPVHKRLTSFKGHFF
jgi:hypothetical protein